MEPDAKGTEPVWTTWRIAREIGGILLVLAVVAGSILLSYQWLTNRPRSKRRPPRRESTLVEVAKVRTADFPVRVRAMGTVIPARKIVLAPRVGGEIVKVSADLIPGGRLRKGQAVASIDREDYELALMERRAEIRRRDAEGEQLEKQVAQRAADLVRAESEIRLEKARIDVARKESELLGEALTEEDRDLVLRGPQLASAKASLAASKAAKGAAEAACKASASSRALAGTALKKAEINLRRTEIAAPFPAVVTVKSVDPGAQVSPGTGIATIVGTDEFWIEVALPVTELRWIQVPASAGEAGSAVRIFHEAAWGADAHRTGAVLRLLPELEPKGRLARLIVSVRDPLCLQPENRGKPVLILNAYVRAVIDGSDLKGVIPVPRPALRDGNRVWVMGEEDTLLIREVAIVWHGRDRVCVQSGLADGDRIVTSDLGSPVPGMALRVPGEGGSGSAPPGHRGEKSGPKGGRG